METKPKTIDFRFELKALANREFEGHGSVFRNVDLGGDIVVPGAFRTSLADHKKAGTMPLMFWMHQADQVPGKWTDMHEDEKGLYVKGALADTQLGNEMHTLMGMKAVRGLSIGYSLSGRRDADGSRLDRDWDEDGNRLLKELDLWEVSIVSLAMNPLARIESAKARLSESGEYVPTIREVERSLREAGYSKSISRFMASKLFDDDDAPGGMPGGHRRESGDIDQAAADALKALEQSTALMLRGAFSLK